MKQYISKLSFIAVFFFAAVTHAQNRNCQKALALVDAYRSGHAYLAEFQRRGATVVHIDSGNIPTDFRGTWDGSAYTERFQLSTGFEATVDALAKRYPGIVGVLPGLDGGAVPAARLSLALAARGLNVPRNPALPALSNKAELAKALGYKFPQIVATKLADVYKFMKDFSLRPDQIVLKAPESAASIGIAFPNGERMLDLKFDELMSSKDILGRPIRELVVMPRLQGIEYVVNTVTRNGRHFITDIWRYSKRDSETGGPPLYEVDYMIPFRGEHQDRAVKEAISALNKLQISDGVGHIEVFVTDKGDFVTDFGNRPMGSNQPAFVKRVMDEGQIEIAAEAYLEPEVFAARVDHNESTLPFFAAVVTLSAWKSGVKNNHRMDDFVRRMPGVVEVNYYHPDDKVLDRSNDLLGQLGDVRIFLTEEQLRGNPMLGMETVMRLQSLDRESAFTKPAK